MRAMAEAPASPTNRGGAAVAVLVIAAAVLAIGCSDKGSKPRVPPVEPEYLPATSPHNVVLNLKKSWQELNYDAYASTLSDEFVYVFAQQDIGGPDYNPPTWGRADDLLSAFHLFSKADANSEGYVAESVSLSFNTDPEIPNDMGGWTKITLTDVFLTVVTYHRTTGDPLYYEVVGDRADLWFAQAGGTWKVVRWEDRPLQHGPATQPSTWGQIKGMFKQSIP